MVIVIAIPLCLPGCASGRTVVVTTRYQPVALPPAALPLVPVPPGVSVACASPAAKPGSTCSHINIT